MRRYPLYGVFFKKNSRLHFSFDALLTEVCVHLMAVNEFIIFVLESNALAQHITGRIL